MPPPQSKPAPDFIPADPDFIPANGPTPQHQYTSDEASGNVPFMQDVQHELDSAFQPTMAPPNEGTIHHILRGAGNVLVSAGGAIPEMMAHPLETAKMAAFPVAGMIAPSWYEPEAAGLKKAFQEHPEEATEGTVGNLLGGAAAGDFGGELGAGISRKIAPILERGGLGLGNTALGARGPKPFKYGANPARGVFEEGVLPALSKHSAAMKLDEALPGAGERISNAVAQGGSAPLPAIARSIEGPASEARSVIQGPGGGNRSVAPIDALQNSMTQKAPGAGASIYGPKAGTPFTPDEAMTAMQSRGRPLLMAPQEDIPLHSSPDVRGRLSKPVVIEGNRAMPREFPNYGINAPMMNRDLGEIPGEAGDISHIPPFDPNMANGMKFNEYMGQRAGDQGGLGQPQGVLRARPIFPATDNPSPLIDLRHPTATANDLWRTIQNVDKNTRFNPDPEVEGVNELRREMRGGLRGNLEEAVPGLKPLSQRYGDLKSAEETLGRTLHSGTSLRRAFSVPMFPLESTAGRIMYDAAKTMAGTLPETMETAAPPAGAFVAEKPKKKEQ